MINTDVASKRNALAVYSADWWLSLRLNCGQYRAWKKVAKRRLQMPQRPLQRHARHVVKPRAFKLFLEQRQRGGSVVVADAFLPLFLRLATQAQHVIADHAHVTERLSEDNFRLRRGVKPEAVRALDVHAGNLHENHPIHPEDSPPEEEQVQGLAQQAALSLPGMNARGSRAD